MVRKCGCNFKIGESQAYQYICGMAIAKYRFIFYTKYGSTTSAFVKFLSFVSNSVTSIFIVLDGWKLGNRFNLILIMGSLANIWRICKWSHKVYIVSMCNVLKIQYQNFLKKVTKPTYWKY